MQLDTTYDRMLVHWFDYRSNHFVVVDFKHMTSRYRPYLLENGTKLYPIECFADYMKCDVETCRDAFRKLRIPLLLWEVEGEVKYFYLGMTLAMAIMVTLEFAGPGFKILGDAAVGDFPEPEVFPLELISGPNRRRLERLFERTLIEYGMRQRSLLKTEMTRAFKQMGGNQSPKHKKRSLSPEVSDSVEPIEDIAVERKDESEATD